MEILSMRLGGMDIKFNSACDIVAGTLEPKRQASATREQI
jgi:hypothetical protein